MTGSTTLGLRKREDWYWGWFTTNNDGIAAVDPNEYAPDTDFVEFGSRNTCDAHRVAC